MHRGWVIGSRSSAAHGWSSHCISVILGWATRTPDFPRRRRLHAMRQPALFNTSSRVASLVMTAAKDFESLFEGFDQMRAISYVASPDLVLEFFEKRGYKVVEVLVGENDSGLGLARNFRQGLSQQNRDVAERLVE